MAATSPRKIPNIIGLVEGIKIVAAMFFLLIFFLYPDLSHHVFVIHGKVFSWGLGHKYGQEAINQNLHTNSVWILAAEDTPNPFVMRQGYTVVVI